MGRAEAEMLVISTTCRQSHAVLDQKSRVRKAEKIRDIVSQHCSLEGASVLDIGVGSGDIAESFAHWVGPRGRVTGTDTTKQNAEKASFDFRLVEGLCLPFGEAVFDLVIYNHVIEHVGTKTDQLKHLREVRRVLKPGGLLYLAVPNRLALIEPHYRVPFLSWLPTSLAHRVVAFKGENHVYDCRPLLRGELADMLEECGFAHRDVTAEATRIVLDRELGALGQLVLKLAPRAMIEFENPITPTLVFVAWKSCGAEEQHHDSW